MYLNYLSKEQKELALDLFIYAANVDKRFDNAEKAIIKQYCNEMKIELRYESNSEFLTTIEKIATISSTTELKMILVELAALILSDDEFVEEEKQLLDKYLEITKISKADANKAFELVSKLTEIYSVLNELVFG